MGKKRIFQKSEEELLKEREKVEAGMKKEIKIKLCNYKLHRIQRLCDVIEKCKIADKIRLNKKLKKVLK